MTIVILGLSITSSWGNGHATTWRGLVRELAQLGHRILFLERDMPWYADNRDLPNPPHCRTELYASLDDLYLRFSGDVRDADVVVAGSYVPEGILVNDWLLATARNRTIYYDIDTPVTLAGIRSGDCAYLAPRQIPGFDLYLSFTGGPTLRTLEREFGARHAKAFYCSVDPASYYPEKLARRWALGYLGTYSSDRQPKVNELLCGPAAVCHGESFIVAGPLYPADIVWPGNVERIEHLPPDCHRSFYNSQRATLNVTRADMVAAGYSPSVRLFEAAACATPILSDRWDGMEEVLTPGEEILLADGAADVIRFLSLDANALQKIGDAARRRVLSCHTAAHRARQFETVVAQL